MLLLATILGDHFSYFLGRKFAIWTKKNMNKIFLEERHLDMAHDFYVKHGGKTILFCKLIAFVRTFAPFIAGIGKMKYIKFLTYNVVGGILWVALFTFSGYYFGNIPIVKNNFSIVILIIIIVSFIIAFRFRF